MGKNKEGNCAGREVNGITEKERAEEEHEYYRNIDRCASESLNKKIMNGRPAHAVYLMTKMFSQAQNHVRLYTGTLADKLKENEAPISAYDSRELVDAAAFFFKKSGSLFEVIVQKETETIESRFFIMTLRQMKKDGKISGDIKVRNAPETLTAIDNHFMVVDDMAYRLETDHDKTFAVANFNDKELASILAGFFDKYFMNKNTRELVSI